MLHDHLCVVNDVYRGESYDQYVQKVVEPHVTVEEAEQYQREDGNRQDGPDRIAVADLLVFGADSIDGERDPHGKDEGGDYEHVLRWVELDQACNHVGPEGCEREEEDVVDGHLTSGLFATADDAEENYAKDKGGVVEVEMFLDPLLSSLTRQDIRTCRHSHRDLHSTDRVSLDHKLLLVRLVSQRWDAVQWCVLLCLFLLLLLLLEL